MDTAFLEDKPLDEVAKTPEDEARAAEELYASQLAKELRVSFFLGSAETSLIPCTSIYPPASIKPLSSHHQRGILKNSYPPGSKFWSN